MSSLHFSFKVLNLVDTRPKADELKQQSDSFRKIKHCSKKFLFFTKYVTGFKLSKMCSEGDEIVNGRVPHDSEENEENKMPVRRLRMIMDIFVSNKNKDKFVRVTDQTTKETKGIQLSSDGTLAFSSLEQVFPGCSGLKYSIPSIGDNFVVPFDDKKMVFTAPSGGWTGKDFQLIPCIVIRVTDQITKKPRGIQLSPDGTLAFSSLERVFPGCWGLECSIPSIGDNFVVPFNDKKMVFTAPSGGWTGKDFQLIYQQQIPPVVKASPDTRKLVKPYKYVHGDLPKFDELSEYLFFIIESDRTKSCVTSITKHYFVTFYHNHETWKIGNSLKIYRHDSKSGINNKQFFIATVKSINKKMDFILLKTDDEINDHKPFYCKPPFRSLPVGYYGYGNDLNTLSYCEGVIHADELQFFRESGIVYGPFLLGTVKSKDGNSGAAVWSPEGLVGLNLGVDFTANIGKSAPSMEQQLAHFDKKNYIVTIDRIMEQLMELEAKPVVPAYTANHHPGVSVQCDFSDI